MSDHREHAPDILIDGQHRVDDATMSYVDGDVMGGVWERSGVDSNAPSCSGVVECIARYGVYRWDENLKYDGVGETHDNSDFGLLSNSLNTKTYQ